jgi:hypothetical protein
MVRTLCALRGRQRVGRATETHCPVAAIFDAFWVRWERFGDNNNRVTSFFSEPDCCGQADNTCEGTLWTKN